MAGAAGRRADAQKGLVFDRGLLKSAQVQAAFLAAIGHPLWGALEQLWFCDRFAWDERSAQLLTHPVMKSLRKVTCVGQNTVMPAIAAQGRALPWTSLVVVNDSFRANASDDLFTRSDLAELFPQLASLTMTGTGALSCPVAARVPVLRLISPMPVDDELLERAAQHAQLEAFEVAPHFFVVQGDERARLVLRFTRDGGGRFSRLEMTVEGFRGPVAPRVDLPLTTPRPWTQSPIGHLGRHLSGLSAGALSRIELAVPRHESALGELARFTHAEITLRQP